MSGWDSCRVNNLKLFSVLIVACANQRSIMVLQSRETTYLTGKVEGLENGCLESEDWNQPNSAQV